MEELILILKELEQGEITVNDAEQKVLDLFDIKCSSKISEDCNCCYFTTGEHSTSCPKYEK